MTRQYPFVGFTRRTKPHQYWSDLMKRALEGDLKERSVIFEGQHYIMWDEDVPSSLRGHGGRPWYVRFKDGREFITTNLWHQGEIPESVRPPDNAIELFNVWDPIVVGDQVVDRGVATPPNAIPFRTSSTLS